MDEPYARFFFHLALSGLAGLVWLFRVSEFFMEYSDLEIRNILFKYERQSSKIHKTVNGQSSDGHRKVIKQSSGINQAVWWLFFRQSPGSHEAVLRQSSCSHQKFIRHSSCSHQAFIRHSSGSHQIVIKHSSPKTKTFKTWFECWL